MRLFLKLNGYDLAASPEDKYETIIRVAASHMSEDELSQWIRKKLGRDKKLSPRNIKLVQKLRYSYKHICGVEHTTVALLRHMDLHI